MSRVIYEGTPSWKAWFWSYVFAVILAPALVGLGWLLFLRLRRRGLRYRITDRTVDVESGLFSRSIQTLQLWRIKDIDFHQTPLQRILGIATIRLFATDLTDGTLALTGLPASRSIFDALKDAAEVARRGRVVGVE